jgi:hypothetical protein
MFREISLAWYDATVMREHAEKVKFNPSVAA